MPQPDDEFDPATSLLIWVRRRLDGNHQIYLGHTLLEPRQMLQVICDLVRQAAMIYQQPEELMWQYFEMERMTPEVRERWVRFNNGEQIALFNEPKTQH